MSLTRMIQEVTGDLLYYYAGEKQITTSSDTAIELVLTYNNANSMEVKTKLTIKLDYVAMKVSYSLHNGLTPKSQDVIFLTVGINHVQTKLPELLNILNNATNYRETPKMSYDILEIINKIEFYLKDSNQRTRLTFNSNTNKEVYAISVQRGNSNKLKDMFESKVEFIVSNDKIALKVTKDATGRFKNDLNKERVLPAKSLSLLVHDLVSKASNANNIEKQQLSLFNLEGVDTLLLGVLGNTKYFTNILIRNHNGLTIQAEAKAVTENKLKINFALENNKIVTYASTLRDEIKRKTVDSIKSSLMLTKTTLEVLQKESPKDYKDIKEAKEYLPLHDIISNLDGLVVSSTLLSIQSHGVSANMLNTTIVQELGITKTDVVLATVIKIDNKVYDIISVPSKPKKFNVVINGTMLRNASSAEILERLQ